MNRVEALVALNLAGGIGSVKLRRLIEAFGSPENIFDAGCARLEKVEGIGAVSAAALAGFDPRRVARELKCAAERGVRIVTFEDAYYPALLKTIYDPPPVLYVRGALDERDAKAIAVVGSRSASLYGLAQSRKLAGRLSELGFTIVSGMARGIDTQAHKGALAAGGRTIAVIGSGFNRMYPPENRQLAEEIARQGCVISEFPMDAEPLRQHFPQRNRVISGLALGVLVVEARRNSGALITADFALEQGRDVFAVPGPVDRPASAGTHDLIRQGAALVCCAEDIVEEMAYLPPSSAACAVAASAPRQGSCGGGNDEKLLYGIIADGDVSLDDLVRESGFGVCRLSGLLLKMQLMRLIRRLPGNRFSRN